MCFVENVLCEALAERQNEAEANRAADEIASTKDLTAIIENQQVTNNSLFSLFLAVR